MVKIESKKQERLTQNQENVNVKPVFMKAVPTILVNQWIRKIKYVPRQRDQTVMTVQLVMKMLNSKMVLVNPRQVFISIKLSLVESSLNVTQHVSHYVANVRAKKLGRRDYCILLTKYFGWSNPTSESIVA